MNDLKVLVGKTAVSITPNDPLGVDSIKFEFDDGSVYKLYHEQDCCEDVFVESVDGELSDLIGSPLLISAEESNADGNPRSDEAISFTWTFYKFATARGYVTIRWYGSSNGRYSEEVSLKVSLKCLKEP